MEVDYIIIGQGLCGTFLSHALLREGKTVLVIDKYDPASASRVASGIINPVTGRRVVRTWMIEDLLPFAQQAYDDIGKDIGTSVARNIDMLTFHTTEQMTAVWHERIAEGEEYLQHMSDASDYDKYLHLKKGVDITSPCLHVNLDALLSGWRSKLQQQDALRDEYFEEGSYSIERGDVIYKDVKAQKLIYCNGVQGFNNDYFNKLPYAFSKGEALIVKISDLPQDCIYKQGMNLVPLGNELFWMGSSFEWDFVDASPSNDFIMRAQKILEGWLKLPYEIITHSASVRPGSLERRPFVGIHPSVPQIGILNGMGTKGCSLAPFFAAQLTGYILRGENIHPAADIGRFRKAFSRK